MTFQVYCYDCGVHCWTYSPREADYLQFAHKEVNPSHRVYAEEFQREAI